MLQIKTKISEANKIVKKYMAGSVVVGLVPVPWMDMVALTSLQLKMLHSLAKLYDIPFSKNRGKYFIASLLGGGAPISFTRNFALLVRTPFFLGHVMGMLSMFLFGGASTYAIGKVFIQHFESGGTFLNFDPQQVAEYYKQQLEIGKVEIKKSVAGIKP